MGHQHDIAHFDLDTYDGWIAAATGLLRGLPDWTALVEDSCGGYVVTVGGDIFFCAQMRDPSYVYTEDDLGQFDPSAWNDRSWDGVPVEENRAILERPQFRHLSHR